jgi:hypothetical protein
LDHQPTYIVAPNGAGWTVRLSGDEPIQFEGDFDQAWKRARELAHARTPARVLVVNEGGQAVLEERT